MINKTNQILDTQLTDEEHTALFHLYKHKNGILVQHKQTYIWCTPKVIEALEQKQLVNTVHVEKDPFLNPGIYTPYKYTITLRGRRWVLAHVKRKSPPQQHGTRRAV